MKFFINDKPLKIVKSEKKFDKNKFTTILNGKDDVMSPMLVGDLFIFQCYHCSGFNHFEVDGSKETKKTQLHYTGR